MRQSLNTLKPWITFSGCVLVIAVLYWAQAILIPLALALLITFVLAPPVTRLQAWIGRVPSVLVIVAFVFTLLGGIAWGLANQVAQLAADLPAYRGNIRQKISDVREARRGVPVETVQKTLEDIQSEVAKAAEPEGTPSQPVIVRSQQVASLWGFPNWVSPLVGPLSTAALVVAMVIFMLLEREDLRSRVIRLVGHGNLAATTKAFEEAGTRVSRQLLMQAMVNVIYGVCLGIALALVGVPYPLFWASLGAALRFIPYVGPVVAGVGPLLAALAALPGWRQPLAVTAVVVSLEIFTNLVLETVLYAGAAGVSQVALLVAVAFWAWLWGPMGLLMATPLTVCMVVLGKHVPGLYFLSTLMADMPALSAEFQYYQRLLARDQSEASDLVERYVKEHGREAVYDGLLLPALNYTERDRLEGRLSDDDEVSVVAATRELMSDAAEAARRTDAATELASIAPAHAKGRALHVIGYPINGASDATALAMLGELLRDEAVELEILSGQALVAEIVATVRDQGIRAVCIADLPPSAPSKTRYLVKKLRAAFPDLRILVGRWAPPELADGDVTLLTETGANHVTSTLIETRDRLRELAHVAAPDASADITTA